MSFENRGEKKQFYSASEIDEVSILPGLSEIYSTILDTCEFFFKGKLNMVNPPFRGFLLEGPPGTGKTELIKQVARKLDMRLRSVSFAMIDGASIAAPRWGEAEKNLRNAFHKIDEYRREQSNAKMLVLFDDIESLMLSRGATLAKEWHYAINSILFHELDQLNPMHLIVCGTSNRPDLVDDAIRTRLYPITVPPLPVNEMVSVIEEILEASEITESEKEHIIAVVLDKLNELENPTIREARYHTVVMCIREGVWKP